MSDSLTVSLSEEDWNVVVLSMKVAAESLHEWIRGTDNAVLADGVREQQYRLQDLTALLGSKLVQAKNPISAYISAGRAYLSTLGVPQDSFSRYTAGWDQEDWTVVLQMTSSDLSIPTPNQITLIKEALDVKD